MSTGIGSVIRALVFSGAALPQLVFALTTITFDDVPDKTDIRSHYQSQGVSFACDGAACYALAISNAVYARTNNTVSSPNSVTTVRDGFPGVRDISTGRVIARFNKPVKTVSIDARSVPALQNQTAFANIIAYDASGAVVASAAGNQVNVFQTLTVSASDSTITKVSMGVTNDATVAVFDNLRFDRPFALLPWLVIIILVVIVYWVVSKRKRSSADA